jgi:hypothetical protein
MMLRDPIAAIPDRLGELRQIDAVSESIPAS